MAKKKKGGNRRPPAKQVAAKQTAAKHATADGAPGPETPPKRSGAKSKKRERTGPTQAERIEAARLARRRKQQRARLLVVASIAAVVLVIAAVVVTDRRDEARTEDRLEAAGCRADTRADAIAAPPSNHVAPGSYSVDPPAGGSHDPAPASPGIYGAGDKPTDAQIVHALEHGYVALWYKSSLSEADVKRLEGLANKYERDTLLVPRDSMDVNVAATAWERRLLCPSVALDSLDDFVTTYRNKGPEKVPH